MDQECSFRKWLNSSTPHCGKLCDGAEHTQNPALAEKWRLSRVVLGDLGSGCQVLNPHPLLAHQRAQSQTGCIQIHSQSCLDSRHLSCLNSLGWLGHTFLLFSPGTAPWSGLDPSQRLRNGPGMLLDQVSAQTVDSRPISGHFS